MVEGNFRLNWGWAAPVVAQALAPLQLRGGGPTRQELLHHAQQECLTTHTEAGSCI